MRKLEVTIPNGPSYPIMIGDNLHEEIKRVITPTTFAVVDSNVAPKVHLPCKTLVLDVSEATKTLNGALEIYNFLSLNNCPRSGTLISIGGGALGDVAGFVAGTYLRGISWINVATTLLSQVDAAVGGKVGINLPTGKNLVGLFFHPKAVFCPIDMLKTVPPRELISGLGEVIKYGLIVDPELFCLLESRWDEITKCDPKFLEEIVERCLVVKRDIVQQDERDIFGIRQVLNFGHTFGHAIEASGAFSKFCHGEAVILGMRAAVFISQERGFLEKSVSKRIQKFLSKIAVPRLDGISFPEVCEFLMRDKKFKEGKLEFVLLEALGKTRIDRDVPLSLIEAAFNYIKDSHETIVSCARTKS